MTLLCHGVKGVISAVSSCAVVHDPPSSVTVTRRIIPRQGERLAQFLDRAIETRDTTYREVARAAVKRDGQTFNSWERKLRRWGAGRQQSVDKAGAQTVGHVLEADFSPFVRPRQNQADLLTEILDRLDGMDRRLQALERG